MLPLHTRQRLPLLRALSRWKPHWAMLDEKLHVDLHALQVILIVQCSTLDNHTIQQAFVTNVGLDDLLDNRAATGAAKGGLEYIRDDPICKRVRLYSAAECHSRCEVERGTRNSHGGDGQYDVDSED